MTRFTSNTLAAFVAIIITTTSLTAITQVPSQPQASIAVAAVLA